MSRACHVVNQNGANPVYSQSKLAQMMLAYELQHRIKTANKAVINKLWTVSEQATDFEWSLK